MTKSGYSRYGSNNRPTAHHNIRHTKEVFTPLQGCAGEGFPDRKCIIPRFNSTIRI
jgi:hypothetical protein